MDSDTLKVLIVDDEKDARLLIRHYLKSIPQVGTIEESENVEDALFKTVYFGPDLIFLDIMMPGRNGAELMELIEKRKLPSHVVVVSGVENSAISAIKNGVYDFILKPVSKENLKKFIDKFMEKRDAGLDEKLTRILKQIDDGQKIRLSSINSYVLINPDEIVYCEAEGSYTNIYLENGTKELANNYLGMIEKSLSGLRFFRLSRSYLINLNRLLKINRGDYTCILAAGKKKIRIKGSKKQLRILSELDFE